MRRAGFPEERGTAPRRSAERGWWHGWKVPLLVGFSWAIAARVTALLVATGARWMLQADSHGPAPLGTALGVWNRWDASNLAEVAEHGYLSATDDPAYPPHATAFFPGFPLVLRLVAGVPRLDPTFAGLLLNLVASGLALAALYRLAEQRLGPGTGRVAVPLLAFAPVGVFLVAGYSEPLFLAGAVTAWYLAGQGRWWLAALPAAVAVGTRAVGVALVVGLLVEYLAQRRFRLSEVRRDVLAPVVALTPLAAWMAWLWWRTGDPLRFVHDQEAGWGRRLTAPGQALRTTVEAAYGNVAAADTTWVFTYRLELVGAVVGVGVLAWCLLGVSPRSARLLGADGGRGGPGQGSTAPGPGAGAEEDAPEIPAGNGASPAWGWAAYTAATLAAYLLSAWYFSVPRGLLGLFPLPLLLAGLLRRRPQVVAVLLATSAGLFSLGVVVFVRGFWVG